MLKGVRPEGECSTCRPSHPPRPRQSLQRHAVLRGTGWHWFVDSAVLFAGVLCGGRWPREWYRALSKPEWNPPNWIFGPVWTTLYLMMGIAAWRVWRRGGFAVNARPLGLFLVQLVLNAAWTPLFFCFHLLGGPSRRYSCSGPSSPRPSPRSIGATSPRRTCSSHLAGCPSRV